jgi:hypothetical protein
LAARTFLTAHPAPACPCIDSSCADLSKFGAISRNGSGGGGSGGGLSLTERIINRFSHPFFSQHDVVLPASPETEEEVEAMVDAILCQGQAGAVT